MASRQEVDGRRGGRSVVVRGVREGQQGPVV